jgi:hypothetical protein
VVDGEIRVEILFRLVDLNVLDRVGIRMGCVRLVVVLFVPMDLLDEVVV